METATNLDRAFPPLTAPAVVVPADPQRTRVLTADGSQILRAPGLLAVESVSIGGFVLDQFLGFETPIDPGLTRHVSHHFPMVRVVPGADGCPLLQRAIYSNEGYWQAGPVHVTGVWAMEPEEAAPAPPAPEPAAESGRGDAPPVRTFGGRFAKKEG